MLNACSRSAFVAAAMLVFFVSMCVCVCARLRTMNHIWLSLCVLKASQVCVTTTLRAHCFD